MAVRASDRITLTVLPSPSYVRTYYLLQPSTLTRPGKPTTNPPASPWTATEPGYTAGSTNTLYTVMLTAYGTVAFEYGEVQVSSSYEAAKQAYNLAQSAVDQATTADGRLTVSTAQPVKANGTGKPVGAVWFRKDGTGRFIGAWEWTGSSTGWQSRAIENAMIATLDAAKINTGYLDVANRIRAGSIAAQKIAVGDFTNYWPTPTFDPALGSLGFDTLPATDDAVPAGAPGANVAVLAGRDHAPSGFQPVRVQPGDQIYMSAWIAAAPTATAEFNLYFYVRDDQNSNNSSVRIAGPCKPADYRAWKKLEATYTVPEGKYQITPLLQIAQNAPHGTVWYATAVEVRRVNGGELIVDGAITARKLDVEQIWADEAWLNVLRAGVIETPMLSAGFSESLDLMANATINLLVGQQHNQAAEIAAAQERADAAAEDAIAAALAAGDAAGAAQLAQKQADRAKAAQEATQAQLDNVSTYYRFGADGAIIGRPDSPTQLHLLNTGAEIRENGQRVTWWEASQMHVSSLVATKVVLGNHQFEKFGNRTVVRAL